MSNSEMIERAKAALRQPMNYPMQGAQEAAGALMTLPAGMTELLALSDLGREAAARIVIAAMREPTAAMLEAIRKQGGIDGWEAAIDAALTGSPRRS